MSKFKNKKIIILLSAIILLNGLAIGGHYFLRSPWKMRANRPVKIVWVNSYHEDYIWSQSQIKGFTDALDKLVIKYEIRAVHLNTYLDNNDSHAMAIAQKAKELINTWNPDLVYATDDSAQKYVSVDYVNTKIPWVYSGVNLEEKDYNFQNAYNVAGVLERKPILRALEAVREILPNVKKITVIGDGQLTGMAIQNEARQIISNLPDFKVVNWYSDSMRITDFKKNVLAANKNSDLIFILWGSFIDEQGEDARAKVYEWLVKNSKIPELTLWNYNVKAGALVSVEASVYDQGYNAGKIVKQILIDGIAPRKIGALIPTEGVRAINLARAKMFDLKIPSLILVNSEVYEDFPWNKK